MRLSRHPWKRLLAGIFCLSVSVAVAQDVEITTPPPLEVLISVADQKLVLLRDGGVIGKYRVSTSKFGVGDSYGSYKTPLGKLKVCDKIGDDLSPGAVIKHRSATGEVIAPNAPGRDPIVTRVIWLEGLEGQNEHAKERGIYIHGTPEEVNIGKPVSWGCIRMRSQDVIEVYNQVPAGTPVDIVADHLPKLHKWKPAPPPEVEHYVAKETPTPAPAPVEKTKPAVASVPASVTSAKLVAQEPMPRPAGEKIPQPQRIASSVPPSQRTAPEANFSGDEPKAKANPEAIHAMKGSIMFSNLPDAPALGTKPPVAQSTPGADPKQKVP